MERNWLTQMPSYRCRSETDGMRISSETDGWDERAVDPRRARCKQQTAGSSSRIVVCRMNRKTNSLLYVYQMKKKQSVYLHQIGYQNK